LTPKRNGELPYTRPGKSGVGSSATIYPDGHVTVYSSDPSLPTTMADKVGKPLDPFGVYAMFSCDGDFHVAADRLRAAGYGDPTVSAAPFGVDGGQFDRPFQSAERESVEYRPPTDSGNAQRLVDAHGDDMRYVAEWGRWLVWDGNRWRQDTTYLVRTWAGEVARETIWPLSISDPSNRDLRRNAERAESAAGRAAMVTLAGDDRRVVVSATELDCHPDLLPVENGTLDLVTGLLRPSRRDDLLTKGTKVDFDPDAACPTFDKFINRILPNPELRGFVQRALGYSITGHVTEQCFFFLFGGGANGKSTLGDAVSFALSEYATPAPEGLLERTSETEVADLQGRRIVFASETRSDGRLNESRIKQLTGDAIQKGRHLYGRHFEFIPTHHLFISGNYKPHLGPDDGIWRRLYLIHFTEQITAEEKDPDLLDKLREELPGVLAWLVRGCLEWRRDGLNPPSVVTEATAEYRQDEDVLGRFIDDCLRFAPGLKATSSALNERLREWCRQDGVDSPTSKTLAQRLFQRGINKPRQSNGQRVYEGVAVLSAGEDDHSARWNL
jgi:putative DNA primase/helicase